MKNRDFSILFVKFSLFCAMGLVSSCSSDSNFITIEQTMDIGGAGRFYAINISSKDTIEIKEGLTIAATFPTLNAKNGNEIRLSFVPNGKYGMYSFNVSYTLPDSTNVQGEGKEKSYIFTIMGLDPLRNYSISMSAASVEQKITSFGKINLKIIE